MAPPRRYTICLDVDVSDQDDSTDLTHDTVIAQCLQLSRQVAGASDSEALSNIFRFSMRGGWVTEEEILAIVGRALATKRKARR